MGLAAAVGLGAPAAAATPEQEALLPDWSADYRQLCLLDDHGPAELRDLVAALDLLGGYVADVIADSDVIFCLDPVPPGCRGYYEPASGIVALSPKLTPSEMLPIAVHELRHVDQVRRGFEPSLDVSRAENVRLTFALEADAQAMSTYVAWRQREAGDPEAWDAAVTLEHYEDIPPAFAAEIDATGDPARATLAAFSAWYASEWRREKYYLSACGRYLDLLDDTHSVETYGSLPEGYFDTLCLLPDGSSYGCENTEEIRSGDRSPN